MLRRFGCEVSMPHVSEAKVILGKPEQTNLRLMTICRY